ncbi:uncharacterized protein [Pseudochaenichthys georgianus]|uniref:uncharacterized protein n=1 Tax=Pseudochaenichthys georgianus TaxID=52239 RepID=UPI0039C2D819
MERETVCLTELDLVNMSKVQMLLSLKKQRLTAAAEEIFALFEKTIAEYEEELSLSKEENKRLQKLLDAVLQPQLRIPRADVQLLVVVKEEFLPDQQEWSTSLDPEDPVPPPHIKQEQEELRISQEGEQLQELEEAEITESTFTTDPVKSEDDKEKPQSSQLIKDKLNTWKQKLMEMTVEDQNQPGAQIQRAVYNQRLRTTLETLLNLALKTVLIGRRPENLHQAQTH